MASYQNSVILKFDSATTGNAAVNEQVAIKQVGVLSPIYEDQAKTILKSNPFFTDTNGFYEFFCDAGVYTVEIGNPIEKSFFVTLADSAGAGGGDTIVIGTTLLANSDLGSDYIYRDGLKYNTNQYPDLSGTPGFPVAGDPTSYSAGANYSSGVTINTSAIYAKEAIIDENGLIIVGSFSGTFMYSEDQGQTEALATTANTTILFSIATNASTLIVGAGISGKIEVFDYNTKISTGSSTAGTINIRSVFYDSDLSLFIALNQSNQVWTASDPLGLWTNEGTISGIPGTLSSAEKTSSGYVIFDNTSKDLYFTTDLLLLSASVVATNTNTNDLLIYGTFDKDSGLGLAMNVSVTSRLLFRTLDGGQNFSSIPFTGMSTATIIDMKHISGNVFVCYDTAENFFYTVDAGDNWTEIVMPTPTGNSGAFYFNTTGDIFGIIDNQDERSKMIAVLPPQSEFVSTLIASPNQTDFYQVRAK